MREFTFRVDLDSQDVKNIMYNNSTVKRLQVLTDQGLRIEIPIAKFQKFVSYNGIHGKFYLTIEGSELVSLEKISS